MGPMNSARVHCSRENSQKLWLENKKKEKKRKERKTCKYENIDAQRESKPHLKPLYKRREKEGGETGGQMLEYVLSFTR